LATLDPVVADAQALAETIRADVARTEARLDRVALLLRSLTGNDPTALWLLLVEPAGHA